jgi:hypothetical protein
MAKAYWINSIEQTITEVTYDSLEDMRRFVGGHLEAAYMSINGDVLYVDENGLYKTNLGFVFVPRQDQVLMGNGLFVGREIEADELPMGYTTLDPMMTLKELDRLVYFVEPY